MRFGKARTRGTIQEPVEAEGAYGGASGTTWRDVEARWIDLRPLRSTELSAFNQTETRISHKGWIRYIPWLTSRHRWIVDGRIYNMAEAPRDVRYRHHEQELLLIQVEGEVA